MLACPASFLSNPTFTSLKLRGGEGGVKEGFPTGGNDMQVTLLMAALIKKRRK
jgi:hypothetical protein